MTNGFQHKIPELDFRRMWGGSWRMTVVHTRWVHERTSELRNRAGGGPWRTIKEGMRRGGSWGHEWRITTKEWRTNWPFSWALPQLWGACRLIKRPTTSKWWPCRSLQWPLPNCHGRLSVLVLKDLSPFCTLMHQVMGCVISFRCSNHRYCSDWGPNTSAIPCGGGYFMWPTLLLGSSSCSSGGSWCYSSGRWSWCDTNRWFSTLEGHKGCGSRNKVPHWRWSKCAIRSWGGKGVFLDLKSTDDHSLPIMVPDAKVSVKA